MSVAHCRPLSKSRLEFLMHLRAALLAYQPLGASVDQEKQESYRQRMARLISQGLETRLDPTCRHFFVPGHFTCSGFVLNQEGTQVWLIAHKKLKLWLQPGGHIEALDETFLAAARREVEEETGLQNLQLEREICDLDIHSIPAIGAEPAHEHYDVRVLYRAVNITTPSPLAGDEKTKSFELSEVIDCNGPLDEQLHTDESVRRVCRQLSLHVD